MKKAAVPCQAPPLLLVGQVISRQAHLRAHRRTARGNFPTANIPLIAGESIVPIAELGRGVALVPAAVHGRYKAQLVRPDCIAVAGQSRHR